ISRPVAEVGPPKTCAPRLSHTSPRGSERIRPPSRSPASSSTTSRSRRCQAVASPAMPPPTTTTSQVEPVLIERLTLTTYRAARGRMFVNHMPRFEVLDPDAIATLERGWKRILTDVGVAFGDPEAIALLRAAGQRIEGEVAFLDPEFVLEQVAL